VQADRGIGTVSLKAVPNTRRQSYPCSLRLFVRDPRHHSKPLCVAPASPSLRYIYYWSGSRASDHRSFFPSGGLGGDEVDDAGQGVGAIAEAGRSLDHFYPFHSVLIDLDAVLVSPLLSFLADAVIEGQILLYPRPLMKGLETLGPVVRRVCRDLCDGVDGIRAQLVTGNGA